MTTNRAIVWVFDSHAEAEACIKELQSHQFDRRNLSLVGPAPSELSAVDASQGTC